jgi:hypothetical protein
LTDIERKLMRLTERASAAIRHRSELRHRADRAGAEAYVRNGKTLIVVIGEIDDRRADTLAELISYAAESAPGGNVSVDLTCTMPTNRRAAAILDRLEAGSLPRVTFTKPPGLPLRVHAVFTPRREAPLTSLTC